MSEAVRKHLQAIIDAAPIEQPEDKDGLWGNEDDAQYHGFKQGSFEAAIHARKALRALESALSAQGSAHEAEQLRVQLAGCSVAALGGISEAQIAKHGDYGYSAAYRDVFDLRVKYEALLKKVESSHDPEGGDAKWIEKCADELCLLIDAKPALYRDSFIQLISRHAKLPAPGGMGRDIEQYVQCARDLTYGMHSRTKRLPDYADFRAAFSALAHPTSESGTKSCLMCGQIGDKAIVHEPSGVYICMNCRAKAESGRVEEQRWIPVEERLPDVYEDVSVTVFFADHDEPQVTDSFLEENGKWVMGSAKNFRVTHWTILKPAKESRCRDCDNAKRHAYSDATTPGFFFDKCSKHRASHSQPSVKGK